MNDKKGGVEFYLNARSERLAEAVRVQLARRGWTAQQLHEKTGISMSQISQIRNGKANPKFETICRLEYAFHESLL